MDKKQIGKLLMTGLGFALTLAASFVDAKNQETQIEETVAKRVADALNNQTKES